MLRSSWSESWQTKLKIDEETLHNLHNLLHNSPFLSHNLPWKYCPISGFLSHPIIRALCLHEEEIWKYNHFCAALSTIFHKGTKNKQLWVNWDENEIMTHYFIPNCGIIHHLGSKRGEEQGRKSPFSLLSEPISPSSLLFISSSRSI